MKFTLMGLLFLSLSAFSKTPEFPVPCEMRCSPMSEKLDPSFIVKVKWESGKKIRDYYLLNNNFDGAFNFKAKEMTEAGIEFYKFNFDGTFTIYLPGQEGDLTSLPHSFRNLLISSEDFLSLPQVSVENKKRCAIAAYRFNRKNEVVAQILAKVTDFPAEIMYKNTDVLIDGDDYTRINVIVGLKELMPVAEDMTVNGLKKFKEDVVCKTPIN